MAFPATVLPLVSELLINGTWTDVTEDIRTANGQGVTLTRGRADESAQVSASKCAMVFDNRSGNYSNRLPTSPYYGLLGRNTQLRHRLRWVYDTFTRSVSNGFGSEESPAAYAWTTTGGVASDYSVTSNRGTMLVSVTASRRMAQAGPNLRDARITGHVRPGVVAAGAAIDLGYMLRRDAGADTSYECLVRFETAGSMRLRLNSVVAGVGVNLADVFISGGYSATTIMAITADIKGSRIRVRAWNINSAEPSTWNAEVTNTAVASPGQMGAPYARVLSGNTNVPFSPQFDNLDVSDIRFWGEVPAWPSAWDVSGQDVTAPIEAAGIMRRLSAGAKPLKSALLRTQLAAGAIAAWPLSDGEDSAQAGDATTNALPMVAIGSDANYGTETGPPGGSPQTVGLDANTGLRVTLPTATSTTWTAETCVKILNNANGTWLTVFTNTGSQKWDVFPVSTPVTYLTVRVRDDSISLLYFFSALPPAGVTLDDGNWHHIGLSVTRNGANIDCIGYVDGRATSHTFAGVTFATGRALGINDLSFGGALSTGAWANPAFYDTTVDLSTHYQAMLGWAGETVAARVARLCAEDGIYFELIGTASDTALVGPQQRDTLLNLLFAAAEVDGGILFEPRDALGLVYRTQASLYNQTGLTLDYAASQVFEPFRPTEDDQLVVNDFTAKRIDGSSARVVADTGPLSTQDPPSGIGVYDEERTYNAYTDSQLEPLAGWRTHVGTWDEARFPQVHVKLHAPAFSASASLTGQAAAVDVGDYLSVTNPPAWLPPDDIELIAQGSAEFLAQYDWDITWNCTPAGPYKVFVLDSATLGRLDGDHALHSAVTTTATSWDVATISGPVMTTVDADDGWQWMAEGELVTVTDVAASTIAFGTVGTATHAVNAAVTPGAPASIAAGDLLVLVAAIRNSGAGVPNTPSGWTRVPMFETASNVQMFIKVAAGSDTMPSVTFAGGVANADTSAQCCRITGKWHSAANVAARAGIASASCLNASAQDIQCPGVSLTNIVDNSIIFYVGWKQDDWTSVATPAGYTEIAEASTTTGDDQAFVWGYKVQATRAFIPPNNLLVTGGAGAISRGAFAVLHSDYQVCTVIRSVNGVVKSHAAGAPTALFPAPHLAL